MHERTQRAIAQLMFVCCCAVPTLITMSCVLVTWSPWYHHRERREIETTLSLQTGMTIEIGDFRTTSPTSRELHDVRVFSEMKREVMRVRKLQYTWTSQDVAIVLHQPKLQSSELAGAWHVIHNQFLCRPERTSLPVHVSANDLTMESHSQGITGGLTFRDIKAWIDPHEESVNAVVQCIPAESRSETPIDISIRRDRTNDQPTTQWTLNTHDTALPCSVLADYLPDLERLGSEAQFTGTMSWQLAGDDWWIDLGGANFDDIWLDRVFEGQVQLSGKADLHLDRCRIEPSKQRTDIAGNFWAQDGMIDQTLLQAAHQHLNFVVHPDALSEKFDTIGLQFVLNSTQLTLNGICRNAPEYNGFPAGVVLCRDQMPLVQSPGTTLNALQLANVLAPAHSVQIPLSNQTSWLMNVLIPPSRPLPRDDRYPPRIRSAGPPQGSPLLRQPHLR